MKIPFFLILTSFLALSCSHSSSLPQRQSASIPEVIQVSTNKTDFLPLDNFQCPAGTTLASGTVNINIDDCLNHYIHRETKHGVTREKTCFPSPTRHENSLRIPPTGKIYASVLRSIHYPTSRPDSVVALNLNHAYYSLELLTSADLTAAEVKKLLRQPIFPRQVHLERCVCDITQNSEAACLARLSFLLEKTYIYNVETVEI